MADLTGVDSTRRQGPLAAAERIGRAERELERLRSSIALLRNTDWPDNLIPATAIDGSPMPGKLFSSVAGFSVPAAGQVVHTITMTVPDGATKVSILAIATVYAFNSLPAGSSSSLRVRAELQSTTGNVTTGNIFPVQVTPTLAAPGMSRVAQDYEGLEAGQQLVARAWAGTTNGDWAANANNIAELAGQVVWWA